LATTTRGSADQANNFPSRLCSLLKIRREKISDKKKFCNQKKMIFPAFAGTKN
jgi:hypothetical protein